MWMCPIQFIITKLSEIFEIIRLTYPKTIIITISKLSNYKQKRIIN